MEPLVEKFGSRDASYVAVDAALRGAAAAQLTPVFNRFVVNVGLIVNVNGVVINGVARIGTMGGATMANAAAASAFRNLLKRVFTLNPFSTFRVYPFAKVIAKYVTPENVIEAAGRTSGVLNQAGEVAAAGGANASLNREACSCGDR